MFDELLTKNILSLHDLCDLHITFPHPSESNILKILFIFLKRFFFNMKILIQDQEVCPGVQISPCDLIHPVKTTPSEF